MAGTDPAKIARLPYVDGLMKNEVVIHRFQRNHYDNNLRSAGARLVEIGSHRFTHGWELENAIGPQTAAVAYFVGPYEGANILPLEKVLKVAKDRGVPVIVDAAAAIPPASNLWRYTHMGAALAIFSGGKGLGGPQSTGLVLGRKDLIAACKLVGSPNYALGRPFKVGKEEMAGLLAAVEHYLDGGESEQRQRCEEWANQLVAALSSIRGLAPRRASVNTNAQPLPEVQVELDEVALGVTREELVRRLWDGNPRVYVPATGKSAIVINPDTLKPGEVEIVVERLRSALQGA
jgi:L-seryl-tRNA(Ser) seleniumtransferase